MSKEQYNSLQEKEQRLLSDLQRNPWCSVIMDKLSKIQWKLSLYEQEPLFQGPQIIH